MKRSSLNLFILTIIVLNIYNITYSSDGTLDTSFNGTGFVNTPIGTGAAPWVQVDSKIVVSGVTADTTVCVARYNLDGSLDTTFGSPNGFVVQPPGVATAIIIQPDLTNAKILIAGNSASSTFLVARYNSDGSLDTTFGAPNGFVESPIQGREANAIALQTDKKIVVVGNNSTNLVIARYNTDGSLDTTFAGTGFIIGPVGFFFGLAIQDDGKIVVAGGRSGGRIVIARYNPDGTLDLSFNGTGIIVEPFGGGARAVAIQSDGNIVVAGASFGNFLVLRLLTDGTFDTSFNFPNGFNTTPPGLATSVLLQSDGKVILPGTDDSNTQFRVARYLATGELDVTDFAPPLGFVTGPMGFNLGGALLASGKIVASGLLRTPDNFVVALYNNNNPLVNTTITSPINGSTIPSGPVMFSGDAQGLSFVYLYIDGIFIAGFPTDPNSDTWSYTTNVANGMHTAQVVSIYNAGHLNFQSDPITFIFGSVAPTTTSLVATKRNSLLRPYALAGNSFSYNIAVTNTGSADALNVVVQDNLPNGVTYISSTASNGSPITFSNNILTANIGTIAVNETVNIIINVTVNSCFSGILTNISNITSSNASSINAINSTTALIPSFLTQEIINKYC